MISLHPDIVQQLHDEVRAADERYGAFASSHEGYGVLAEEVAELLESIHTNSGEHIRREAIQVAAVALRLAGSVAVHAFRVRSGFNDHHDIDADSTEWPEDLRVQQFPEEAD